MKPVKTAVISFNIFAIFFAICAVFAVIMSTGQFLTEGVQLSALFALAAACLLPIVNFGIAWGFKHKKLLAWHFAIVEMGSVFIAFLILAVSSELSAIFGITLPGAFLFWLFASGVKNELR